MGDVLFCFLQCLREIELKTFSLCFIQIVDCNNQESCGNTHASKFPLLEIETQKMFSTPFKNGNYIKNNTAWCLEN